MERLSLGILAHVDAGKTTLSEAMLYRSGAIRRLGRVDHGDAFLDSDVIERERGITIFSKLAVLELDGLQVTLIDTPGHVDFSAETERCLSVMDCAVLVVSGAAGVQSHTRTLWRLLTRRGVPAFLFVNKMDLPGVDRERLLASLREELDPACVDFTLPEEARDESAATLSEAALEEYLKNGSLSAATLRKMIRERRLFPVLFGSALKLQGVDEFLSTLRNYAAPPQWPAEFSARVFKIGRDPQGARLSYLKVTGGVLRVKDSLATGENGETEKADQLRLYSGEKFHSISEAPAGTVCAVTGLQHSFAGQVLGAAAGSEAPLLEPVLSYGAILPEGTDTTEALRCFRTLEEEDPQLHVGWNERAGQIQVRLMGEVQVEVLERRLLERFHLPITFGTAGIVYRETIREPVEGVGHFEPLRHYAEVHLLMRPLPRGSGLIFDSALSEDLLDRNWQRLILTHLEEKQHLGVLTGSPITDMHISLAAGAASLKHTEGGDFREATYRAVRQGLMCAQNVLLEPWYNFRLTLPADQLGRALTDLSRMHGRVGQPELEENTAVITGSAPVSELLDYPRELASYTKGAGQIALSLRGYEECHNTGEVVAALAYQPERDLENTPDSVFCAHGAGYPVKWNEVPGKMHLKSVLSFREGPSPAVPEREPAPHRPAPPANVFEQDRELLAIFEKTYGKIGPRSLQTKEDSRRQRVSHGRKEKKQENPEKPEYLLVDGYNIIFAWEELRRLSQQSIDAARQTLMDAMANLRGLRGFELILVFDAYKVPGGVGSVSDYHGISVVYTKEAETADAYIEKTAHKMMKSCRVRVATSDGAEQLIILGAGALRVTAAELHAEVESARAEIAEILELTGRNSRSRPVEKAFELAERRPEETEEEEDPARRST